MKYVLLALFIAIAGFSNTYALIQSNVSDEDQEEVCQITKDIELFKTQETEQEWRIFLNTHRYFVQSIIRRINLLVYKYPHKTNLQDLAEVRDYLMDEMVKFGL